MDALCGEDLHAIDQQLARVAWAAASFHIVNEARRLASPAPDGGVQLNGLIHSLIDRGFFIGQIVAVRRLVDRYPLEGQRSVHSLSGLLKDMRENQHLLTRRNIFDAENLTYDYECVRQRRFAYEQEKATAGETTYWVPTPLPLERYEARHADIDALAGVTSEDRQADDKIQETVFVNLLSRVEGAREQITEHANKFIARAATPESRAAVKVEDVSITLGHLQTAYKHLYQVASFLAYYVLGDGFGPFLATPTFDQFQYMDRPLVTVSQIDRLKQFWNEFDEDCSQWGWWDLDAYKKEFSCSSGRIAQATNGQE